VGERIRFAPSRLVTDELRAAITRHKGQLLSLLTTRDPDDELGLDGDTVMRAAFPLILNRMADKTEMLEGVEAEQEAVNERAENCRELWRKLAGLES
jgi:hypothetical protein